MSTTVNTPTITAPGASPRRRSNGAGSKVLAWLSEYYPLVILALLVLTAALSSDTFLTQQNLVNLIRQASVSGIVAIGMLLVILTGGIDLSVGSNVALAAVLSVGLTQGSPIIVTLLVAVASGVLVGLINGTVIALRGIEPFIMTLGMMALARGIASFYTQGQPLVPQNEDMFLIGKSSILGIPTLGWVWIIVIVFVTVLLKKSIFGRRIFAVGSSPAAARAAGLATKSTLITVYVILGVLCGLGAFLFSSRVGAASASMGLGWELEAIAAVVIGGARLAGGKGTVWGTVVGTLIFAIIANLLNLLNVSTFLQDAFRGALIILVVLIGTGSARKKLFR